MKYQLSLNFQHNDEWDGVDKEFNSLKECVDYIDTHHHNGYHHRLDITINGRTVRRMNNQLLDECYEALACNDLMEVFKEDSWALDIVLEHLSSITRPSSFRHMFTNPTTLKALGEAI